MEVFKAEEIKNKLEELKNSLEKQKKLLLANLCFIAISVLIVFWTISIQIINIKFPFLAISKVTDILFFCFFSSASLGIIGFMFWHGERSQGYRIIFCFWALMGTLTSVLMSTI